MSIYDQIVYDDIEDENEGGGGCPVGPPPDSPFIEVPMEPLGENIEYSAKLLDRETGAEVGWIYMLKPRRRSMADILLRGR